jgi:hypothetical protein
MTTTGQPPRYDSIGHGYARTRREDPRFAAAITAALGTARTVVNVGAGAGSYEPRDRHVIAIEPSDVMAAQRPRALAPALRARAHDLPVILTCDAAVSGAMWLMADYLQEVAELDRRSFPRIEALSEWLGGTTRVEVVAIPRDTRDWMLMSFWAHPERVLDADARNATSGFARMSPAVVDRVVAAVRTDLEDGTWDARHGHLRQLDAYDAGLRLVVNLPG